MNPNLCRNVKKCCAFVKIYVTWYCVSIYEGLIIRFVIFLSQCVLCVHEKVELTSYMTPLTSATDIATKLSPNKYWSSRGILLPQMILICLSDNLPSLSRNKLSMSDCF